MLRDRKEWVGRLAHRRGGPAAIFLDTVVVTRDFPNEQTEVDNRHDCGYLVFVGAKANRCVGEAHCGMRRDANDVVHNVPS